MNSNETDWEREHVKLLIFGSWLNKNDNRIYKFKVKNFLKNDGDHDTTMQIWSIKSDGSINEMLKEMPFYLQNIMGRNYISYLSEKFRIVSIRRGNPASMEWQDTKGLFFYFE